MLKVVFACCALIGAGLVLAFSGETHVKRSVVAATSPVGVLQTQQPAGSARSNPGARLQEPRPSTPVRRSSFAANPVPQKTSEFPPHEWVFITESDGLLFGDFIEPIELELTFEYGTAKIPLADIVSFSRVQVEVEKAQNTIESNLFGTQPASPAYPYPGNNVEVQETKDLETVNATAENSGEVVSNAEVNAAEQEQPADNLIVVATRSGNVLVGRCDLADFHLRTQWGTMTIDASRVNTICCKSCGLKRLVQTNTAEGWMLMPLQFTHKTVEVQGEVRQAAFAPQNRVQIRGGNLSR